MANVPPNPAWRDPAEITRRNRQATGWLRAHDKPAKVRRRLAALKAKKDAQQARENPGLIAARRKALGLGS
jgi:hypothetical protein